MPTNLNNKVIRAGQWLAVAMLASLHLALWLGTQSLWTRPVLLAHLGLFLLWQPLWRGESKLRPGSTLFIASASLVALLWLNWWVLAFWVSGLFSLVGGRVFTFHTRWQRWRYLLAMAYLLSVLLLWITPHLFRLPVIVDASSSLMNLFLPLLLVLMALLPKEEEPAGTAQIVDFIYSLLLFMLLTLLVLGSLAFMTLEHLEYFAALLRTLFILALMLFVLGWLWNPRLGFSGLQPIFSRYLLNIGTPFEVWLQRMAETSRQESSPAIFLARAIEHFSQLPWVSGLAWVSDAGHGNLGISSSYRIEIAHHDLHLTLFSRRRISPSTALHIRLLTQLLDHFYQAKRREQHLREIARLQAVYETGSRLTHDLKNMLQSLLSLTAVAQQQPDKAQPVLQQQLPVLTRRIELILGKLKSPQTETDAAILPLAAWWDNLRQRHRHEAIEWRADNLPAAQDAAIPAALFDCIADNLIDNARNKRLREPGITITVALDSVPLQLSVSDSGSAIPAPMAGQLLNTVIASEDGLGVGLYQAARWAAQAGFQLSLKKNTAGNVQFEMREA
jgi:signal transduction histidine kinase